MVVMQFTIQRFVAKVAGVDSVYRRWRSKPALSPQEIFGDIFRSNGWDGVQSVSGTGSDPGQTATLIRELPGLFRAWGTQSVLDVPCGDFHWMKHVDLTRIRYLGGDVVPELIERNRAYETNGIAFRRLDLLSDELPAVDLVVCRDCLVHFSHRDVRRALANLCRSGARYLLTTTFPKHRWNRDIVTGRWRPWNLERRPFCLPAPLQLLVEGCTEKGGKFRDKSLGLWRLEDIGRSLR
jgi:SAM-dependent methyltransferase